MYSNKIFNIKNWFNGTYFPVYYLIPLFLTSYFSVGFFHPDEHFQIIEMANFKNGGISIENMPWEFKNQLRPTLQPFILYVFLKTNLLQNPYFITFLFRFITGLFSILAFLLIYDMHRVEEKYRTLYFQSSFLIWFMPFVSIRYSSETWSALFLVYGIYSFMRYVEKKNVLLLFLSCLTFSMSLWFRFQIGFAIMGFALWVMVYKKIHWKVIVSILTLCSIFIYGFIQLDSWFYQKEVLTPLNYFNETILTKSKNFGDFGLWYYPAMTLIHLFPISIVIFISIFYLYKNHRNHFILYTITPFILIHFIIGHKEIRFLFPMFLFIPYVIVLCGDKLLYLKDKFPHWTKGIVGLNVLFLMICSFKPADIKVFNAKQLTHNGWIKNNIYITMAGRKEFHDLYPLFYQCYSFDSTSPKVQYILDDTKNKVEKEDGLPILLHYDWQKILFWTKAEDCFGSLHYFSSNKNQNSTK